MSTSLRHVPAVALRRALPVALRHRRAVALRRALPVALRHLRHVRAVALPFALSAGLALSSPGPAEAASVYDVIRDCQDGVVDGRYSLKELRRAERSLPSDQSEYSDCQDALHEAQVSARERRAARPGAEGGEADGGDGGGGSGGGGQGGAGTGGASGSPPPLPEDVAALDEEVGRAAVDGPPQVSIGGRPLTPLASGPATARSAAGVISRLPAPMLLAMLGISALCLAAVALTARDRLPGARRLALRLRRR